MITPLSYFQSTPWSAKLLGQHDLHQPDREGNPFRDTIERNNGYKDRTFLYRVSNDKGGPKAQGYMVMELEHPISGQLGIAHGGFLATLHDEVTGALVKMSGIDNEHGIFTANLSVAYHKPLFAKGFIFAMSEIHRIEGRKVFLKSEIRDADGEICSTGEVLFMMKRPSRV